MTGPGHPLGAWPPRAPRPQRPSAVQQAYAERTLRTVGRRRAANRLMTWLTGVALVLALLPLLLIVAWLAWRGAAALGPAFFTNLPRPVGEAGGGMANAIVGTLLLLGVAIAIGMPIGIGAGLYLHERPRTALATVVRVVADMLVGVPSIIVGVVAWQMLVRPAGHYSALAGGVALAAIMVPLVVRATEEMLRLVPVPLREAALALGYGRWRAELTVVLRAAMPGVVTGALIAVARAAGETAALLFTALGNQFWSTSLDRPIAALPLQIFAFANSPYDEWHRQAAAGALVLLLLVFVVSLVAHTLAGRRPWRRAR